MRFVYSSAVSTMGLFFYMMFFMVLFMDNMPNIIITKLAPFSVSFYRISRNFQ